MDVHIDPLDPVAAALHHWRRTRRLASRARRRATPASASTSSTTARSSPTRSASPAPDVVVEPIPEWLRPRRAPADRVCRRRHPRPPSTIWTRCGRSRRASSKYLGLIGSRAKVARIYDALLAEGMPAECLERVHAPIGLEIGAVTPAEIAISILAELIAVRRGAATAGLAMKAALACRAARQSSWRPRFEGLRRRIRCIIVLSTLRVRVLNTHDTPS